MPLINTSQSARRRSASVKVESLEGRQLLATVQQFPLPAGTFVGQMAAGPGGDVWFIKQYSGGGNVGYPNTDDLVHISPSGKMSTYNIPLPAGAQGGSPRALASSPDGSLYVLSENYAVPGTNFYDSIGIDRIAPDGSLTQIHLSQEVLNGIVLKFPFGNQPPLSVGGPVYNSLYFTVGGDGNLYVGSGVPQAGGVGTFNFVDKITPDGFVTQINTGDYTLRSIAIAKDGSIYTPTRKIAPDGTITNLVAPNGGNYVSLVGSPDGNVYFTESFQYTNSNTGPEVGYIGAFGVAKLFPLSNVGGQVGPVTLGPDGNVYFTETVRASTTGGDPLIYKVGAMNPSGVTTEYTVNPSTYAFVDQDAASITTGPNGQIWFAENSYTQGNASIGELIAFPSSLTIVGPPQVMPHGKTSDIILHLSDSADAATVKDLRNYRLESLVAPGQASRAIQFSSASYDAVHKTITLHVRGKLNPAHTYQITVNGSGLNAVISSHGVVLSGNGLGLPGSNFRAMIPGRHPLPTKAHGKV